ncbi:pyridoxamine 5'-phosphate oxidase family protein [Sinanaerobacter sp. ZZT-01]|uniref:pyridoxamine 5'-phosphate oxidase family protein n=1 Tax=Sinanaerobacter sp. ZZT-01 TaxID=3111540 RepID=UPI002D7706EC|nr:pyridoxamine 5'-phosphate oxidase family protein [Sinanaerobacter sp. ZZT-01]WRR93777.1 pyridoxamine 5'-phosphate oxidase family protein [Sinanaerobacter sp. ZZT-01]
MRRKDREMSSDFGYHVIDKARYGILSMIDGDEPYGIPLSIVRHEENLYFHSAKDGRKVRTLTNNPRVSVAFVGEIRIPDNFAEEELKEIASDESKARLLISSVFTTEYESAVIKGKVEIVEDEEESIKAMRLICEKYTPTKMMYFDMAIKAGLKRTNIYRIRMEEIKSKRKRYDKQGKEMKYGRME